MWERCVSYSMRHREKAIQHYPPIHTWIMVLRVQSNGARSAWSVDIGPLGLAAARRRGGAPRATGIVCWQSPPRKRLPLGCPPRIDGLLELGRVEEGDRPDFYGFAGGFYRAFGGFLV